MDVERRHHRETARHAVRHPGHPQHQGMDRTWHLENDPRAERSHHRHIASEMDHIAQSLVRMQQDGLARDGLLAAAKAAG